MEAVRAYCLGEYERIWGRPWDQTWPELHRHILSMRETAQRAHEVWSRLRRAMKGAVDFARSQGLPPHKALDPFGIAGKTVHESVVIHEWLHRHLDAVEDLLHAEDFEKVHSARSMLVEVLGRTRLEKSAQPVGTIRWNTGGALGRELTEREMAYVSLLVGNEPPSLKRRLEDELVSVDDVVEMEREAINTARVRHDDVKKEALGERAAGRSSKRTAAPKSNRAKAGSRRRR